MLEEGKVGPQKGTKQQKVVINARDKRSENNNIRLMCVRHNAYGAPD